jgi:hypothetical protein
MKIRTELNDNETISIGFGRQLFQPDKVFLSEHVGIATFKNKFFIVERIENDWFCVEWSLYLTYINELDAVIKKVKKERC